VRVVCVCVCMCVLFCVSGVHCLSNKCNPPTHVLNLTHTHTHTHRWPTSAASRQVAASSVRCQPTAGREGHTRSRDFKGERRLFLESGDVGQLDISEHVEAAQKKPARKDRFGLNG